MDKKYNTGKPLNIPEDDNERALAISEWSENNIHLENAIRNCLDNNIPTRASCAGHTLFDLAYLSMDVNRENLGSILNIMNNIANIKNTKIALSYMENQGTVLTVTTDRVHKNRVFDTIAKASKETIDLAEAQDPIQDMWNTHKELRARNLEQSLELYNSLFSKKILIRPYSNILHIALEQVKLKRIDNIQCCYLQTFFTKNEIRNFFGEMNQIIDAFFIKRENDEFDDTKKETGSFVDNIKFDIQPIIIKEQPEVNSEQQKEIE